MRHRAAIAAVLVAFGVLGADASGEAPFESELWPGEGRPRLVAKAANLSLHAKPSASSPVVGQLSQAPGTEIRFNETRYRTTKPGTVTAKVAGVLSARSFGATSRISFKDYYEKQLPTVEVAYKPDDRLEYLQDRAEGSCFIRRDAAVLEADACPWLTDTEPGRFRVDTPPTTEWWVLVPAEGSRPEGWILVDERRVEDAERTFE